MIACTVVLCIVRVCSVLFGDVTGVPKPIEAAAMGAAATNATPPTAAPAPPAASTPAPMPVPAAVIEGVLLAATAGALESRDLGVSNGM